MTMVAVMLMDRAGRRPLLLTSLAGMIVAATLLGIFYANGKNPSWLALVSLILCASRGRARRRAGGGGVSRGVERVRGRGCVGGEA